MNNLIFNGNRFRNSGVRWYVLGLAWITAFTLSCYGFLVYAGENQLDWNFTDIIYRSLQLVVLESGSVEDSMNPYLDIARFSLPALTGVTALQAISVFFYHQLQGFRLMFIRNHLVVVGTSAKSVNLLRDASNKGIPCVVLGNINPGMSNIERFSGIDFVLADPHLPDSLKIARINKAAHLVFFLEDDTENLRAALNARAILGEHDINCVIELRSLELVELVKGVAFSHNDRSGIKLNIFNDYSLASKWLIDNDPVWNENTSLQVVEIFGLGDLGTSLLEKILYTWYVRGDGVYKKIILYDQDAIKRKDRIIQEHPEISELCEIDVREVNLQSRAELEFAICRNKNLRINKVYLCNSDPLINLQIILILQSYPWFYSTDIHVRMSEDLGGLPYLLGSKENQNSRTRIFPFDLPQSFCTLDLVLGGIKETLARGLYYEYRKASLMDVDQYAWDKLGEQEKGSNRRLAGRVLDLINQVGYQVLPLRNWSAINFKFLPQELDLMARQEHDNWRIEKISAGWRHGSITDPLKRIHSDLVDWENLPQSEKKKNIQFFIGLPLLLANQGYSIERQFENQDEFLK